MSAKPRLLDLFSGAGGCARGYQLAGFHVTGVDNRPQPRYVGDAFMLGDALEYCAEHGHEYDAIHASPPCQGYSVMRHLPWLRDREYPLLIEPVRTLLRASEKPWVIENVMGAKLDAFYLCGLMFDLPFYRHRLFETSFFWFRPHHPRHRAVVQPGDGIGGRAHQIVFATPHRGGRASGTEARGASVPVVPGDKRGALAWPGRRPEGGHGLTNWQERTKDAGSACGVGHAAGWRDFAAIVGIDWMTRDEVCQAIPPVYCEFIGRQLINYV